MSCSFYCSSNFYRLAWAFAASVSGLALNVQAVDLTTQIENMLNEHGGSRPKNMVPVALSEGSGFVVSPYGHIVTNQHVVDGCDVVANVNGSLDELTLLSTDETLDLALLKSSEPYEIYLPITTQEVILTDDVFAAGFPFGHMLGLSLKVTKGVISSTSGPGDDPNMFQFDAAINGGSSGGPIVSPSGVVVGVSVSQIRELLGQSAQNLNFGIKGNLLESFLSRQDVPYKSQTISNEKNENLGKNLMKSTVHLVCWYWVDENQVSPGDGEEKSILDRYR